jgi:uncharacterized protein DUF4282
VNDFLSFKTMITPTVIKAIYLILTLLVIIAGLATLSRSVGNGILLLILGPLLVRIYAELILLGFKINENVQRIADRSASGHSEI